MLLNFSSLVRLESAAAVVASMGPFGGSSAGGGYYGGGGAVSDDRVPVFRSSRHDVIAGEWRQHRRPETASGA
jgi:hypothetical protein